jgi:broad-specificity NMP kinase
MSPSIFFLTGTSGAGKSTLASELRKRNMNNLLVIDLDEYGVPADVDEKWRQEKTKESLGTSVGNLKKGISTIVCGVSVPSEVKMSESYKAYEHRIYFGIILLSEEKIRERLTKRVWGKSLIDDNVVWAEHLKRFVDNEQRKFVIDGEVNTPEQLADLVIKKLDSTKKIEKNRLDFSV